MRLNAVLRAVGYLLGATVALLALLLIVPAYWPWGEYFASGRGEVSVHSQQDLAGGVQVFSIRNSNGVAVKARLILPRNFEPPLRPVLILGGHETGSRAVELVGAQPGIAIMALDYPIDRAVEADGILEVLGLFPAVRRAALDTPVAVSSAVSWLEGQTWAEAGTVELVGVSLGVPFAAAAAAADHRIAKLWLVHGAADNLTWLHLNVVRRMGEGPVSRFVAQIFYWVLCAPNFDTPSSLERVSPRTVTIIGGRQDQRTPPAQVAALHRLAPEPKRLLWTSGGHVDPGELDTIRELLRLISGSE